MTRIKALNLKRHRLQLWFIPNPCQLSYLWFPAKACPPYCATLHLLKHSLSTWILSVFLSLFLPLPLFQEMTSLFVNLHIAPLIPFTLSFRLSSPLQLPLLSCHQPSSIPSPLHSDLLLSTPHHSKQAFLSPFSTTEPSNPHFSTFNPWSRSTTDTTLTCYLPVLLLTSSNLASAHSTLLKPAS